jgi:TonB family protein
MEQVEKIERYAAIPGAYPKAACVEKLSGTSIITAVVDAQGTVGDTSVAVPSKSPVFDDVAQLTVSGMNFGAKGKPIAYQVPVEFKYDSNVCGSASLPKNSAQPQSTATPQNSSTPQKSPEG